MSTIELRPARISASQIAEAKAAALTYAEYVASIAFHAEEIASYYEAVRFTPDERFLLSNIEEKIDILAIVDDWCPDVIATLPIFARIAEINGGIALHVLRRPAHQAIADAYPAADGRSHIPTYIVLDAETRELGVFIERADVINEAVIRAVVERKAELQRQYGELTLKSLPREVLEALGAEQLVTRRSLREIERSELVAWLERATSPVTALAS